MPLSETSAMSEDAVATKPALPVGKEDADDVTVILAKCAEEIKSELVAMDTESDTDGNKQVTSTNGAEDKGKKRAVEDGDTKAKPKRRKVHGPVQPKNAVCQLNEIQTGLKYLLRSQDGPTHSPVFEVSVEVNGETFIGRGRSKKLAKQAAAESALSSFVQFVNADQAHRILRATSAGGLASSLGTSNRDLDFTSDEINSTFDSTVREPAVKERMPGMRPLPLGPPPLAMRLPAPGSGGPLDKNPVMILNELHPNLQFEVTAETGDPHARTFSVRVVVDGQTFEGTGSSKKLAKAASAKSALATLHQMKWSGGLGPGEVGPAGDAVGPYIGKLPQRLADFIAGQVQAKFMELTANNPNYNRRKVLAGIVMLRGPDIAGSEVVAVTTGTKCINGEHMSVTGGSINDCHAEIVARRCLRDFFYSQLELHLDRRTAGMSVFYPDYERGGFRLHEGVRFHLYISTAPCGDARIFSPHEGGTGPEVDADRHPNRKARGKLRTKIESGEGTIPVKQQESVQTWDGVLQGQRLLTMSCSDKIARWNVLGVQGSMLSHFLPPIYLDSVIVGSLFHPQHMFRALCGRLAEAVQGLPPPFVLSTPLMNVTSSSEQRQPTKTPNFSLNWTLGQANYEIVNCTTGKTETGRPSRLCKYRLFERFRALYGRMPALVKADPKQPPQRYVDAKVAAADYQLAKEQLDQAFQRAELGSWVKKPMEQDMFELNGEPDAPAATLAPPDTEQLMEAMVQYIIEEAMR